MKKLTSLLCALTIMLGANAMVNLPKQVSAADDATIINLGAATYACAYNMAGTTVSWYDEGKTPLDDGIFRIEIREVNSSNEERLLFYTYIYIADSNGKASATAINTQSSLGIDGVVQSAVVYNNQPLYLNEGVITISVLKDLVKFNGSDYKQYDITCYGIDSNNKTYAFTVQLPVLGVNNALYDSKAETQKEGTFFIPSDTRFLWDEEQAEFNETYGDGEFQFNNTYMNYDGFDKGVLLLAAENATTTTNLQFILEKNADLGVLGIPEGNYPINFTDDVNTMSASIGVYQGSPYESYSQSYVQQNGQWYIDKRWYMIKGNAVVANVDGKLNMTIDAENGFGKKMHIVISNVGSAVEEIEADVKGAVKTVENGQLVIIRNGVRYNAQGAVVE